jgi:hypothetical protein
LIILIYYNLILVNIIFIFIEIWSVLVDDVVHLTS